MRRVFALTTLALLLGACDTKTTETTQTTETASTESSSSTESTTGTATTVSKGGLKDTLVSQTTSDIPTLDPGATYDSASAEIVENLYETLVTYKGSSLEEVEPLLATEWEQSEDGLTYRFPLREGVKFHSGNDMTCADAEYSFQRNLVTNNASSATWFLAEPLLGTSKNANDDTGVTWDKIDAAVQCEDNTLVFKLAQVDPAFLTKLAYASFAVVDSKHAKDLGEWDGTDKTWKDWVGKDLAESELAKKPSGTGPYQLVSKDAKSLSAKAFDGYWGDKPALKNVVIQNVPEQSSRIQAFLNGDADLIVPGGREVVETQLKGQPGVVVLDDLPRPAIFGFTMNQNLEGSANIGGGQWGSGVPANFFQDENMRKCVASAFDYQAFIEQVQLGKGGQVNVALPKEFMGYDESVPAATYDMDAAQQACEAAHGGQAWDQGFTLTTVISENNPIDQTAMEILKTNLEGMNPKFKVNVVTLPWSDILTKSKSYAMAPVGWSPDYADPDNFLYTFYGQNGTFAERTGIKDQQLEDLLVKGRTTVDTEERKKIYSEVAKYLQPKNYLLLLPVEPRVTTMHDNLQGRTAENYNPLRGGGWLWSDMSKSQ